jgi:predicted aldo/keto reductase-like oxidoreductase
VEQALKDDLFQIILFCFGFLAVDIERDALRRAADKGKALVAMKTLMGGYRFQIKHHETVEWDEVSPRLNRFPSMDYRQSALKFALSKDYISNAVISMDTFDQIDCYLGASGEKYCKLDQGILEGYEKENGARYCRIGCEECHPACPSGVPVNDILRYQIYFQNYGDWKRAQSAYRRLPSRVNASQCLFCRGYCDKQCPHGIPVRERMQEAHALLNSRPFDSGSILS